jgi:hypothetical protein
MADNDDVSGFGKPFWRLSQELEEQQAMEVEEEDMEVDEEERELEEEGMEDVHQDDMYIRREDGGRRRHHCHHIWWCRWYPTEEEAMERWEGSEGSAPQPAEGRPPRNHACVGKWESSCT